MPVGGAIAVAAAPALITATGSVIQGKQQSNAAKRAAAAQERAANQALDYQKSRDALADSRYDKKFAIYQEAVNDYRRRNGGGPVATGGGGGGAVPVSIADLISQQQGVVDAQATADPKSIAGMMTQGGWNDWSRYGA